MSYIKSNLNIKQCFLKILQTATLEEQGMHASLMSAGECIKIMFYKHASVIMSYNALQCIMYIHASVIK